MKTHCLFLLAIFYCVGGNVQVEPEPSCDSPIFCKGKLLHTIQMNKPYKDSKTFVDKKLKFSEEVILSKFETFMKQHNQKPTPKDIEDFVNENFEDGNEVAPWTPTDYTPNPKLIAKIKNKKVQNFTKALVGIWPTLSRTIRKEVLQNQHEYSIIPISNGFIVPGGRFKEVYYWDTYWVIRGLLLSDMHQTAKGMLNNFLSMVKTYGFIPNGGRIYYLDRSQPPLLTLMAWTYYQATHDIKWLKQNIYLLEKELEFWVTNKTVSIKSNGCEFTLAHYKSKSGTPRPESYSEDIHTCSIHHTEEDRIKCYVALKSGAESGWDFSSRWFFDKNGGNSANISYIQTGRVIPVDLNSFLAQGFKLLGQLFGITGNLVKQNYWTKKSNAWVHAIEEIMYNSKDGIWYDYDLETGKHREYFYPSNFAPLWAELYDKNTAQIKGFLAGKYFRKLHLMSYKGGIPTSVSFDREQWDYPNAWAPLQSIVIFGLEKSGSALGRTTARFVADNVLFSYIKGFEKHGVMYEKYDANNPGEFGKGGEYTVQSGFGWTNGVALELIDYYYAKNK